MKKTHQKKKTTRGQMRPLSQREVSTIQNRLHTMERWKELALFRLGICTMFRASDLVRVYVDEVLDHKGEIMDRFWIVTKKTGEKVEVTISQETQHALKLWLNERPPFSGEWLFPGGTQEGHISEKHYRELSKGWFAAAGLDTRFFATHSIRRTKASIMYAQTQNLKAVSELLGHTDTKMTERYLGVTRGLALDLADKVKI